MPHTSPAPAGLALLVVCAVCAASSIACGGLTGKDNEDRFLDEMRQDIDKVQADGYKSEDGLDARLVGTADPRTYRAVTVSAPPAPEPPPPGQSYYVVPDEPRRMPPSDPRASIAAPPDDGPNPVFTNANLAASIAAYEPARGNAPSKTAAKRSDGSAKPAADAGAH